MTDFAGGGSQPWSAGDPPGYPPPPAAYGYYGPPLPVGMYYDPVSGLVLPEGVEVAGVGRRILAGVLSIPLAIVTLVIGYAIWGLIVWGRGQTPALQVLGMRCWRPESGRPAGWWWMALREIGGRAVEGVLSIITLVVSFVLMVARNDHQTLHDLVAGTVVVHDPYHVLGP